MTALLLLMLLLIPVALYFVCRNSVHCLWCLLRALPSKNDDFIHF